MPAWGPDLSLRSCALPFLFASRAEDGRICQCRKHLVYFRRPCQYTLCLSLGCRCYRMCLDYGAQVGLLVILLFPHLQLRVSTAGVKTLKVLCSYAMEAGAVHTQRSTSQAVSCRYRQVPSAPLGQCALPFPGFFK